jgi:protein-tyrosine phosphatase
MAEAILRHLVREEHLSEVIAVDSAGIGPWHVGELAHPHTRRLLRQHGLSDQGLVARQIQANDIAQADYVIAMDREVFRALTQYEIAHTPPFLFMDLLPEESTPDVPDPYYVGNFDQVYQLVDRGCRRLLDKIKQEHHL